LKTKFLIIIFLLIVLILVIALPHLKPPEKTRMSKEPPEHRLMMMAFFENGWGGIYGDSFPGFQENYQFIDVLSPFWYSLDEQGQIRVNRSRAQVRALAESRDIHVIPLVTNWQGGSSRFLTSEPARRTSLANLLNLARNYQGLNLDVEYLPVSFRESLALYVQGLRGLLAREKKQLFVCVYPQVDFPEFRSGLHDYRALSAACDGLIMMAYDYHRPGTPAGPVAPIHWVEANIQHALKMVPPDKLWLGIPGYGYRWGGQAKTVAIPAWKAERDAMDKKNSAWDRASQTPYYIFGENSAGGVVWYEDKRSAGEKLKLARKYKLRGVALWRLGYEVRDFWSLFRGNG
jgi:spore germination protein